MKVSKATAIAHRDELLAQAARLFRRQGIGGVGVADVTRAAGLTHGAFYGHFLSKAALAAEAAAVSLHGAADRWRRRAARARVAGADPLMAIVASYLSPAHRDTPEEGCALATLGPEISRAGPPLHDALRAGTCALLAVLDDELAARNPAQDAASRQQAALAMLAAMTGGLLLARALAADEAASLAALRAATAAVLATANASFPG